MKNNWLAASNFERMHQIITALNIISVHAKLKLAGIDEPTDAAEIRKAREELTEFLAQLNTLLYEVEHSQDSVVVGDDPRLGELTMRYLSEKRRWLQPSGLYSMTLADLSTMLHAEHPDQLLQLIDCLRELRVLLEQHSQADVRDILGEI